MHLRTQKLWNPKVVICSIRRGKSGLYGTPPKISGPEGVKRFREYFNKIVLGTVTKKLFDINSIKPEHQKIFTTQKDIVISTLNEAQKKGAYIRNDYKE